MRALPGVLSGFSKQRAGRRRGSEQMEMKVPELNTAVFRPGSRVISACSGGADSIALLELLNRYREKLKINLTAVHVHHGLRDTAERDAAFVKEFCESRGIACIIRYVDVPARVQRTHETVEEAARILRYEALLDAAPALNGMSKRRKPHKYSAKPYDITGRSRKAEDEQSGRAKMENGKAAMIRFAEAFNRSRKMKNGGDVNGK